MVITVNGEKQSLERSDITVADVLILYKVARPEMVSVQVNGQFVDAKDYGTTQIDETDEVDFLYFMGGGRAL